MMMKKMNNDGCHEKNAYTEMMGDNMDPSQKEMTDEEIELEGLAKPKEID